jgi:hypothetical protein
MCAAHLGREETLLDATVQALQLIRAALLRNEWNALPGLLRDQDRLARLDAELQRARERIRQSGADFLGVAASGLTLETLARGMPAALGDPLLCQRERVLGRAREAAALRDANAALLGYSLDFLRKLIAGLAGGAPDRYGPGGRTERGSVGFLMQARG